MPTAAPATIILTVAASLALAAGASAQELIFEDGFESGDTSAWSLCVGCDTGPGIACPALTVTPGTTLVAGSNLASRTVAWNDAGCEPRSAVMVDQRMTGSGTGYLRRLTYRVGGIDRVCTGLDGGPIQGMGYVTNHLGDPADWGGAWGNWTAGVHGTTTVVLEGPHHAILEYAMPNYPLGGNTVPTTVQWLFATGRSHPLFSLAQDARGLPAGNLGADSRSPYGAMEFPGDDDAGRKIGGVSWGDTFKFVTVVNGTTAESTLLTGATGWRYDQSNSIPYVLAWANGADAEQGTVATSAIFYQDQGSDSREWPITGFQKGQIDLDGPLPKDDDWAYQMMNYPDVPAGGTTDKKMAWGTNVGALGGFDNWWPEGPWNLQEFSRHRDSTTPWSGSRENGLLLAYSTFVVFGTHAGGYESGTTGQVVTQMESHQLATLTAAVGAVRQSGPRGVGPAVDDVVTYAPAGYNHVYATWEVDAAAGAVDATLTADPGRPIADPIFVVHGYPSATPPAVALDGLPAVPDVDYFATVDVAAQRLWLTVPGTVASSLRVEVAP